MKCKHERSRTEIQLPLDSVHYVYDKCIQCGTFLNWSKKRWYPSVDIHVSFDDKDYYKSIGAYWDPSKKTWYIPYLNLTEQPIKCHKDLLDAIKDKQMLAEYIDKATTSYIIEDNSLIHQDDSGFEGDGGESKAYSDPYEQGFRDAYRPPWED